MAHRGCRLNDNLDGTLSFVIKDDSNKYPVIVSRMPMDSEEIVEPSRPTYPAINKKHIVWVKVSSSDQSLTPTRTETPIEATLDLSPDPELVDGESELAIAETADGDPDAGMTETAGGGPITIITEATDGRPYGEWWGKSAW